MVITDEKIEVTYKMMEQSNLTRYGKFGVPKDPKDINCGIIWTRFEDLKISDLDIIEEYFIIKKSQQQDR